jgi:hypothetical protein
MLLPERGASLDVIVDDVIEEQEVLHVRLLGFTRGSAAALVDAEADPLACPWHVSTGRRLV